MPGAPERFVPCWCRLEHNDIEEPKNLIDNVQRNGHVRIVETSKNSEGWGPLRAPRHCTVAGEAPQVALHLFRKQHKREQPLSKEGTASTTESSDFSSILAK